MLAELCNRFDTIRGLADDLDPIGDIQQRHQSLPHNVVILDHHHSNRFLSHAYSASLGPSRGCAACNRTEVPVPGSLVTSSVPPIVAARSRIPVKP